MSAIPSLGQRAAAILTAPSEGPEPLRRHAPSASPYPLDALGPVLGTAARRIHEVVHAPDAVCGQSALAAASLAVQGLASVAIDGRTHPLSLWCIAVAESGERKSAADGWALRAHVEFERERVASYAKDWKAHSLALHAHEDASKAATAKHKHKDRVAILDALEAIGDAPEPPLLPQLLCSEPTLEGLHKLLQNGFPSLGLFTDEAGQLFGGHAMSKDNVTADNITNAAKLVDWHLSEVVRLVGMAATKPEQHSQDSQRGGVEIESLADALDSLCAAQVGRARMDIGLPPLEWGEPVARTCEGCGPVLLWAGCPDVVKACAPCCGNWPGRCGNSTARCGESLRQK